MYWFLTENPVLKLLKNIQLTSTINSKKELATKKTGYSIKIIKEKYLTNDSLFNSSNLLLNKK